ncbi:GNAT family N-acetyltransferase [Pseudarthrobacter sp. J64]|uniref:GNAT family N-acetyltransferase n=1 Tax=Pseudarthrobacter sp. J64 TaxID=3116485 RepID=UPI002E7FEC60|nr:GNAT family N-acetyltransferase [Pseudarthrobacter sp. J64]MEE2570372.1 GNAT family N-acetyltransferase [Pseudarthrobacter sp. J64]
MKPDTASGTLLTLDVDGGTVRFREAVSEDVAGIVRLVAEDPLAAAREDLTEMAPYEAAFAAIDADPAHLLVVGELFDANGADARGRQLVATFQLSFLPGLSRKGSLRSQIEAVRVADILRGQGVGQAMVQWAIGESRRRGCGLVQLTTDKSRTGAHRFYERLGFEASHEGMKLRL